VGIPLFLVLGRKSRVGWAQSYPAGLSALWSEPTATIAFFNYHLIYSNPILNLVQILEFGGNLNIFDKLINSIP
jgi:hypothetical protein